MFAFKCDFQRQQFSERLAAFDPEVGLLPGDYALAGGRRSPRALASTQEFALQFLGVPTV